MVLNGKGLPASVKTATNVCLTFDVTVLATFTGAASTFGVTLGRAVAAGDADGSGVGAAVGAGAEGVGVGAGAAVGVAGAGAAVTGAELGAAGAAIDATGAVAETGAARGEGRRDGGLRGSRCLEDLVIPCLKCRHL